MQNNPIRYSDPSGHRLVEDYGNGGCSTSGYCLGSSSSTYTSTQLNENSGDNGGSSDDKHPDSSLDDDLDGDLGVGTDEFDFHFEIGTHECDTDCQHTLEGLFVFGTTMDSLATGINFMFALAADVAFVIDPLFYAVAVKLYQPLSIIPNIIGSVGGATWIVSGFISGDNSFEITVNNGVVDVSGSIAQDTIATVIFDGAGWAAREPNIAFSINGTGTTYDLLRNPFDPILPTFFQPSFSQ